MINIRIRFAAVIILVILSSCKKENITEPNLGTSVILPLASGNTWKYQRNFIDTLGNTVGNDTVTMTILGPDTIGSTYGYSIINGNFIYNLIQPFGLINRQDGLYAATVYPPPTYTKALPFPTIAGDEVVYDNYQVKTKSLQRIVSVPAGTFTCVEYEVSHYYYHYIVCPEMCCSPNVGIIKLSERIGYLTYEYNLISYTIY